MSDELRKKEIKVLEGLRDKKSLDLVCSRLGISTICYLKIVKDMQSKGIYPNIAYTDREYGDFNVDLAIQYLKLIDTDAYYFEENSALSFIRNCDINSLIVYYEGLYSCRASGGVRNAIRVGYGQLESYGVDTSEMLVILQSFKNKSHASADNIKLKVGKLVGKRKRLERQETARIEDERELNKLIISLEKGVSDARSYHKGRELELLEDGYDDNGDNTISSTDIDDSKDIHIVSTDNTDNDIRDDNSHYSGDSADKRADGEREERDSADKRADGEREERDSADKRADGERDPNREGDSIFNKTYTKDDFRNKYSIDILKNMSNELIALYIEWEKNIYRIDLSLVLGIEACYRTCNERGVDTLNWMSDAYKIVFRKLSTGSIKLRNKSIHYFIAIIRNWQNFGRGSNGWWQDMYVINFIEKKYRVRLSEESKHDLYSFIGKFGCMPVLAVFCESEYETLIGRIGVEAFICKRAYYCICNLRDSVYHIYG